MGSTGATADYGIRTAVRVGPRSMKKRSALYGFLCFSLGCVLVSSAPTLTQSGSSAPSRLTVRGSQLIDPEGKNIRLTGFNMAGDFHGNDTAVMRSLLPGANVVRLVGLLWDNAEDGEGNPDPMHDCKTETEPYIKARLL